MLPVTGVTVDDNEEIISLMKNDKVTIKKTRQGIAVDKKLLSAIKKLVIFYYEEALEIIAEAGRKVKDLVARRQT